MNLELAGFIWYR